MTESTNARGVVLIAQPPYDDALVMYAEFLRCRGLTPVPVTNATDALIAAPTADLIVTGIRLPGECDGIELITRLRGAEETQHKPIIVVSACAMDSDRARVKRAGCDVFLPKPCLPEELFAEIRRLLATSRELHGRARNARDRAERLTQKSKTVMDRFADRAADQDGSDKRRR
jgi:DNA-binding response OmpR family regulator